MPFVAAACKSLTAADFGFDPGFGRPIPSCPGRDAADRPSRSAASQSRGFAAAFAQPSISASPGSASHHSAALRSASCCAALGARGAELRASEACCEMDGRGHADVRPRRVTRGPDPKNFPSKDPRGMERRSALLISRPMPCGTDRAAWRAALRLPALHRGFCRSGPRFSGKPLFVGTTSFRFPRQPAPGRGLSSPGGAPDACTESDEVSWQGRIPFRRRTSSG
jgi:hypothetical protein